jgi:hypothetical protein
MSTIVAGNVNSLGLLYGPDQFRELILEPTITSPDLAQVLTITDDIKAKKDVLFGKRFNKVTHLDTGCGTSATTPNIPIEKLTWDPVALEAWIKECGAEFRGTFMAWGLGVGYKANDLTQASIKISAGIADTVQIRNYWNEFVQDMMEQAIRDDIYRIGYFGRKNITAGNLTLGAADVPNYSMLNGLWPQLIALGTASANPKGGVRAYTITANQTASQELAPGESVNIFRALLVGADRRLLSGAFGTPIIQCTQSIIDNWAAFRETQNLETSFALMANGMVGPKFRNTEIAPQPTWDDILFSDFTVAGTTDLPHRAVLTTKANMQLGFDSYDAATQVEAWYNQETKYTNMRGNWMMDAKVMRPFLTRLAY